MSVQQAGTDIRVLRELEEFPLVEALFGRRSRRFARGGEIPDGPLAYRSGHEPVPWDGAVGVHHELRPGSSPGPRLYDRFFKPGAYLRTHAEYMQGWARRPEGV
jgi:hypothetical protein